MNSRSTRAQVVWSLGAMALFASGLMFGALGWSRWAAPAQAQLEENEPTGKDREKRFDDLARDVAALEAQGALLKRVVKLISPSVVHIEAEKQERVGGASNRTRKVEEAGSGVLYRYRQREYVITNRHVIRDTELSKISINLADGRTLQPVEVWTDADTDIAVMAVSADHLIPARIGDSDTVEIGDFVLAVGSPFGLSRSVTFGIVSAKGRRDLKLGDDGVRFQDFLQTDAAINPGNSGGPLLNLRGEVIGINTAIASSSGGSEGIGFSIPINMCLVVARQLIEHGVVQRAYLGVSLDRKFTQQMAQQLGMNRLQGARITGITPGSPAEQAGLRVGDVVLQFNGVKVENDSHLVNLVSLAEIDKEVAVTLFRDRRVEQLAVKVGDRSRFESRSFVVPDAEHDPLGDLGSNPDETWDVQDLGLTVAGLDAEMRDRLQLSNVTAGLVVTSVDPRGPTAGKVDRGEIIDQIDRVPIRDVDDLERVLNRESDDRRPFQVHFLPGASRKHTPRTLVVRPLPERQ